MISVHRLQISDDDVLQKPRAGGASARVIVPYPHVVENAQRSSRENEENFSRSERKFDIRRNRKNERVDGTALEDLAMWISQSTHVGISFVTGENELNLANVKVRNAERKFFLPLTFDEVPDSLRKPVNTKI